MLINENIEVLNELEIIAVSYLKVVDLFDSLTAGKAYFLI